ncbi:MAG: hypothetical protein C4325_12190, partial [Blastocatellia bacterium]
MSDLIAKKYKLGRKIAQLGISCLYHAENVILGNELSLLLLPAGHSPQEEKEFLAETRLLAKIYHRNALNLLDIGGDKNGNRFAIFEAVPGPLLAEILEERGKLSLSVATSISQAIAEALQAAAAKSVFHCSLSPARVLVSLTDDEVELVKVFGFGMGNALNGSIEAEATLFAAPELRAGKTPDEKSEVFSLSAVTYFMLTGNAPFSEIGNYDALPAPLSSYRADVPPLVETTIVRALSAEPELRPTLKEFAAEINPAASESTKEPVAKVNSLEKWKTAMVIFVGVLILAAALIYATRTKIADPATTAEPIPGSLPVQPINPATGVEEENLAKLPLTSEPNSNATSAGSIDSLPGGDGYNP